MALKLRWKFFFLCSSIPKSGISSNHIPNFGSRAESWKGESEGRQDVHFQLTSLPGMWSYTVLTASKTFSSECSPPVPVFQLTEEWARAAMKYLQELSCQARSNCS